MNNYYQADYNQPQSTHTSITHHSPTIDQALKIGLTGAVIGAASAATKGIIKHRKEECEVTDIVKNTTREAASTGAASMAGSLVTSATRTQGLLAAAIFISATIGAKYLIEGLVSKKTEK